MRKSVEQFIKDELLTSIEVASILGIGPENVRHMVKRGSLQGIKFGRDWIFDSHDFKKNV